VKKLAVLIASGALVLMGLAAVASPASAQISQSGPFGVGNLLNYANADIESTNYNWSAVSNVSLLTQSNVAFLHDNSLRAVAAATGAIVIELGTGSNAVQISLPKAGATYQIGAYFKVRATSGHTAEFDLQCFTSSGRRIGWEKGGPVSLNSSGNWQYAQDTITVPSNCAQVQASPRITVTGLGTSTDVRIDEVSFAPHRAALLIGAHADTPPDWESFDSSIGPLQSDKVFFTPTQPLPSQWNTAWNNDGGGSCYQIEQDLPASQWPVCVIAYKQNETQQDFVNFFTGLPSAQEVIMVYWQEPEGAPGTGPQFVSAFDAQASAIRAAANDRPNIFVAEDSSTYQYDTSGDNDGDEKGAGCSYIPAASQTDFYFGDHYVGSAGAAQVNGTSLPTDGGGKTDQAGGKWSAWLNCVQPSNHPIGLAEYGLDCAYTPDVSAVTQSMAADDSYLAAIPGATEPTLLWEYWYEGGCIFDNSAGGIAQWQANENQNGGAVNGN